MRFCRGTFGVKRILYHSCSLWGTRSWLPKRGLAQPRTNHINLIIFVWDTQPCGIWHTIGPVDYLSTAHGVACNACCGMIRGCSFPCRQALFDADFVFKKSPIWCIFGGNKQTTSSGGRIETTRWQHIFAPLSNFSTTPGKRRASDSDNQRQVLRPLTIFYPLNNAETDPKTTHASVEKKENLQSSVIRLSTLHAEVA